MDAIEYATLLAKDRFIKLQREYKTWEEQCVMINPLTNEFTKLGEITFVFWGTKVLATMAIYGKAIDEIMNDLKKARLNK